MNTINAVKKLVLNPKYEKALYAQGLIFHPAVPNDNLLVGDEIRTNNPNYISDGSKESDRIPKYIEIEE